MAHHHDSIHLKKLPCRTVIAATTGEEDAETLENAIEHDDTIDTEELSDLLDRPDDLERRLVELEGTLDELRAQPVKE